MSEFVVMLAALIVMVPRPVVGSSASSSSRAAVTSLKLPRTVATPRCFALKVTAV